MWRQIGAVFTKEWRDAVRDRRSLVSALTYSLAGPLLVGVILLAMARAADPDRPLTVAVAGGERAPSLVAFLEQRQVRAVPAPEDASRALRGGEIEAAIVIAEDHATRFAELRPAEVRIAYDGSRASARRVVPRVRALLEEYAAAEAAVRLVMRGVSPAVARPLRVRDLDVSSAAVSG
jgi:sodium transport system permease protein